MNRAVLLSFEKPRFPNLISAETALNLLSDMATHKNTIKLSHGLGVYGGVPEKCIRIDFDPGLPSHVQDSILVLLTQLARWAGQESILAITEPFALALLPPSLEDETDPMVGRFFYVQQEDMNDPKPPRAWREVACGPDVGDHTLIDGHIFVLDEN